MANNVVPIGQARMPAAMRERVQAGQSINRNFSEGTADSFPRLSIKGKVFTAIEPDLEEEKRKRVARNADGSIAGTIDVVLVNGSNLLSKAWYAKGFEEGDMNPPDCWSLDSVKPDPSVVNKVNPTCPDCPKNRFNSAPNRDTESGMGRGKACQDYRRVAVMSAADLVTGHPKTYLLKVPATSLKNLRGYAQLLERQGWETRGCLTRLGFDHTQAYPKLTFYFVDGLSDEEYQFVVEVAESPAMAGMLKAPDFDAADTTIQPTDTNPVQERRVRQTAPVFGGPPEDDDEPEPEQQIPPRRQPVQQKAEPVQQKAAPVQQKAAPLQTGAIQLATGEWFDPDTGEYVDAPVEEPFTALDPDVTKLPDGRFFHKLTRKFLVSDEVGAAEVSSAATLLDGVNTPKKTPPKKKAAPKQAPVQAQVEPEQEEIPGEQATVQARGTNGKVAPAPADLDDILKSVLPGQK